MGRPKKIDLSAVPTSVIVAEIKARQAKLAELKAEVAKMEGTEVTATPGKKRGPGRPKGSGKKAKKGKVGRPATKGTKAVKATGKKRGRPLGSKNKPKVAPVVTDAPVAPVATDVPATEQVAAEQVTPVATVPETIA